MPAIQGRNHRSGVSDTIELRGRVKLTNFEKAHKAAAALGISMAAYLDRYLDQEELDAEGRPTWWTDPVPADQEELPLKSA